ncbi:MAG: FecR family protein [Elusimicrobiota bacterium]
MKKILSIFICVICVFYLCNLCFAEAIINAINGEVTINNSPAAVGQLLSSDDVIKTASGATAEVLINEHKVNVSQNSELAVSLTRTISGDTTLINVMIGKIRAVVKKLKARQKFEVKTPTAICAIRGTDFSVEVTEYATTRLEVYEGIVSAKEETTGKEVMVYPGEFTTVQKGESPTKPEALEGEKVKSEKVEEKKDEFKSEAQREIFMELSRESVLERAQDEIKLAEYQNGKALIDVFGKRVRLEEYVYRPPENKNQFKYVVLNERENRFDFGKILFTFNKDLPAKLNDATQNMFHSEGSTEPQWYLTNVDSIMSNTYDKVLEEASGGKMIPDNTAEPSEWNVFFNEYRFYIGNEKSTENGGKGKLMWQFKDNGDNVFQLNELTILPGTLDASVTSTGWMPDGISTFHFAYKDTYSDGTWIEKHNYIINDDGKVQTFSDIYAGKEVSAEKIKDKILSLNFENVYTSNLFSDKWDKKIDLIFSSKLLSDSGILQLPNSLNKAPKTN